jgi:hypothetical protein
MLDERTSGRFGRTTEREIQTGLLVRGRLENGKFTTHSLQGFPEPRHIIRLNHDLYVLSTADRIYFLDANFSVTGSLHHPLFAFLHTLDFDRRRNCLLVTSSGFDAVMEIDLASQSPTFVWSAWEAGFNPDQEGTWLTLHAKTASEYMKQGKKTLHVDPVAFGSLGIVTQHRTAHPNAARYVDSCGNFLVSLAQTGSVYRVDRISGACSLIADWFGPMAHGFVASDDGWEFVDTTVGIWWQVDSQFQPVRGLSVASLEGKPSECRDAEWLQQVIRRGDQMLFLDANRGLLAVDPEHHLITRYKVSGHWAIQDALFL